MIETRFRECMEQLRDKIAGTTAIVLIGPGAVIDHLSSGNEFDSDALAEYATLLRIARRASQDAGTGDLVEHIVVSEKSVIVARTVLSDYFLILAATHQDQLGRARYELKRAAQDLERIL